MRHLDIAAVTVGDAAAAADIEPAKLSAWLQNRTVRLSPRDKAAEGSGDKRLLTIRSGHAVALAAQAARLGLRHSVAGAIARKAVGEPSLYERQAFVVQRGRDDAIVVAALPPPNPGAVVVDATAVIRAFDERLAARVPELRRAGFV